MLFVRDGKILPIKKRKRALILNSLYIFSLAEPFSWAVWGAQRDMM